MDGSRCQSERDARTLAHLPVVITRAIVDTRAAAFNQNSIVRSHERQRRLGNVERHGQQRGVAGGLIQVAQAAQHHAAVICPYLVSQYPADE